MWGGSFFFSVPSGLERSGDLTEICLSANKRQVTASLKTRRNM